jgi:putative intracellular protease/amidase
MVAERRFEALWGVWSPEFVYPHDRFTKAGYEVVVATLGGVPAPVDPASLSLGLQENDQASVDFQCDYVRRPEIEAALARPARLEELNPGEFDVIFVPGGFGVFEDLRGNPVIGRMIAKAYRQDGKIVGALCSGVSALLGARADDGSWLLLGNVWLDSRRAKWLTSEWRKVPLGSQRCG